MEAAVNRTHARPMPYYTVLEALQAARGCGLCELEAAKLKHYFEVLFYENVNDGGIRAELVRARGYCRAHADHVLSCRNGLGTAILYQDQVRLALEFLESMEHSPWHRLFSSRVSDWKNHAECPACRMLSEVRDLYSGIMARWLHDPEMKEAFAGSPGCCVEHALAVADRIARRAVRREFVAAQREKYTSLLHELEEFVRKQDYRYRNEPAGSEVDSWQRAVRMMAGA